jgi:hypothetical protein
MGYSQSYLSAGAYGYDFVVATTQESVNATMKAYLAGLNAPEVIQCYVYNNNNEPQLIDYNTLLQQADISDLFGIPNATPASDPRLVRLANAGFAYAFKAAIGLPPGYAPDAIPDIVTLNPSTSTAVFNLMCSEFTVVELTYGPRNQNTWLNQSQPSGDAWIFTSNVALQMLTVGSEAYNKLPPAVQKQINNLGANAFSVQQLLFDLDNAALETVPKITNVAPGTPLYTCLQTVFLGAYFTQMQAQGQPVLGYTIAQNTVQPSSLTLTGFELEANAFVGTDGTPVSNPTAQQQQTQTLCYLCAANGNSLRPPTQFNWNWIDLTEASQHQGVMAINRNTLANYIAAELAPMLPANCYSPHVRVWLSGTFDTTVNYQWGLTSGQTPTQSTPASGPVVLTYSWQSPTAEDDAGLNGDMGKMKLSSSFNASVSFQGNTIVISQHLVVYAYIRSLATGDGGNVVDKTVTDTYTLAVDQNGDLMATQTTTTADHSQSPGTNGFLNFFTDLNSLLDDAKSWANNFAGTRLTSLPISVVQSFVFPGGNTFTFSDACFSNNQDLVAHITYVQPS